MLTFWFAGLAAILLNTAGLYEHQYAISKSRLIAGLALALAGLLTPYARTGDSADQRFYVTVALAPLALAGLLLVWGSSLLRGAAVIAVFPHTKPPSTITNAKRVTRAPDTPLYRNWMPILLGIMFAVVVAVVVTVLFPALFVLLR